MAPVPRSRPERSSSPNADDAVPCHRVVFKDGHFYARDDDGSPTAQKVMLDREGTPLLAEDRVDLDKCRWTPGTTDVEGRPTDIDWAAELGDFA